MPRIMTNSPLLGERLAGVEVAKGTGVGAPPRDCRFCAAFLEAPGTARLARRGSGYGNSIQ